MADPYRESFGIGNIGGGLEAGSGESLSQLSKTEEVLISIANQLSGLTTVFEKMGSSVEKFQPVAKEMTKSKFVKSSKGLKDMFKSMGGASLQASAISLLFKTLKPLLDLFKPFQVILDIISSLLEVLVGEALGPMFEALQPLFDALIGLMPVFAEIGAKVGELIAAFLGPFVEILLELMPAIGPLINAIVDIIFIALQPLMDIFLALLPIVKPIIELITNLIVMAMEPLKAIFDAIMPILIPLIDTLVSLLASALKPMMVIFEAFMPILIPLIELALMPLQLILTILQPILEALAPVFELLAMALEPLKPVLKVVAAALGFVGDAFKFMMNAIINAINFVMNVLTLGLWKDIALIGTEKETITADPKFNEGTELMIGGRRVIEFAEGGIALSETSATIGEGGPEAVIPLTKWEKSISAQNALLGLMHDELITQSFNTKQLVKDKEWKRAFEL